MTFIIFHVEHKNMFYADYTFQSVSTSTTRTHNPTQQTIQQKYIDGFDFRWSNPAVYALLHINFSHISFT